MGKFSLKNLFGSATDKVINEVGKIIDDVSTTKDEKAQAILATFDKELEDKGLVLEDKANARAMQIAALAQSDKRPKRFIYNLATFWSVFAGGYIIATTFFNITNERVADTVIGFLLGTAISAIIQFFFGSSEGSSDKQQTIKELLQKDKK